MAEFKLCGALKSYGTVEIIKGSSSATFSAAS